MEPKQLLTQSFRAAVAAADPLKILPAHLPHPPSGETLVVGAGKAAASMALAVEQRWPRDAALEGLVITRYRHGLPTRRVKVIEAGHPVPDETGESAAKEILQRVRSLSPSDLLLALISGGGSALLSLPVEAVGMQALKATTRELLRSGAPIQDINTVRKHLSAIHGGRLAAACKARVLALIISDVTGDDPTHIASGPCAPDPTTYRDALEVLRRHDVDAAPAVVEHLERGARGEIPETPKPGDETFSRVENRVIATARQALLAAHEFFDAHRIHTMNLGDSVTGEASEVAKVYAELAGIPNVHAIACDTDGIDGSEDNAGAVLLPDSLERGRRLGLDARKLLANNDGYGFFSRLEDLVVTGPTRTNVNDYRAILIR